VFTRDPADYAPGQHDDGAGLAAACARATAADGARGGAVAVAPARGLGVSWRTFVNAGAGLAFLANTSHGSCALGPVPDSHICLVERHTRQQWPSVTRGHASRQGAPKYVLQKWYLAAGDAGRAAAALVAHLPLGAADRWLPGGGGAPLADLARRGCSVSAGARADPRGVDEQRTDLES
jgi:hypothetical protein